jgi:hypothetical protein
VRWKNWPKKPNGVLLFAQNREHSSPVGRTGGGSFSVAQTKSRSSFRGGWYPGREGKEEEKGVIVQKVFPPRKLHSEKERKKKKKWLQQKTSFSLLHSDPPFSLAKYQR